MASNLSNTDNLPCADEFPYSQAFSLIKLRFSLSTTILIYCIYLLPFCFGIFGNISVCLIFFQQRKLRSITNTFLMNLCLNDLIVLCVSIPMTLSAALLENWVFGAFLCKFVNFTPTLTALVSTFTVAIIAVERWLFIVNKKKFDRRFTIIILILLWLGSILIALPEFISRQIFEFAPPSMTYSIPNVSFNMMNHSNEHSVINNMDLPPDDMSQSPCYMKKIYFCVLNPGLRMRIFSYIVITVQYLVPFLFVSVSCYLISRFLQRRMKQMRTYQVHQPSCTHDGSIYKTNQYAVKKQKKRKFRCDKYNLDEVTEHELTSFEETAESHTVTEKSQINHVLTRIQNKFQHDNHHKESLVVGKQKQSSSTGVDTIVMPTARTQSHSERRFHRSRKLLICVAALFTISWLPLTVVQIYLEHNEEITRDEPNFVYAFLLIPCYLISSLSAWMNPVIYNYINRSFRREFYALYPCFFKFKLSSHMMDNASEFTAISPSRIERPLIEAPRNIPENMRHSLPRKLNKSEALVTTSLNKGMVSTQTVLVNDAAI